MKVQLIVSNEIKGMSGDKDTHTIKDFGCLDVTQNTKDAVRWLRKMKVFITQD